VRSGDTESTLGNWIGPFTSSPALLVPGSPMPLTPNPSMILQLEFTLTTTLSDVTPILHDFDVAYDCTPTPT
jgi:hypothetical protein